MSIFDYLSIAPIISALGLAFLYYKKSIKLERIKAEEHEKKIKRLIEGLKDADNVKDEVEKDGREHGRDAYLRRLREHDSLRSE